MNYRHAFHAGNFADVMKHACLTLALTHLAKKPKPLFLLDTHAGTGVTPLKDPRIEKTGELAKGVGKLLARGVADVPDSLTPYLDLVQRCTEADDEPFYPGSPWIAHALSQQAGRGEDRFVFCERHPEDAEALTTLFGRERQVTVQTDDGYQALSALLPPPERRGLVLIDPPYEERDEADQLTRALDGALRRWRSGSYLVWYPIKDPSVSEALLDAVAALDPPESLVLEMQTRALDGVSMAGCGLVAINPPWTLADQGPPLLEWLAAALADGDGAKARIAPLSL